jgi:putative peptidoglycan lipid II flippase
MRRIETGGEKALRTAFKVSIIIALSKIAGFAREIVFAAYFGQKLESDAYVTSYSILNIMFIAFSAGIASTFIPIYTKTRLHMGERRASLYGSYIFNLYMIVGLGLSVLSYFFAPQICGLIYQGSPEGLQKTIYLTRIMFPTIFFWAMTGVLTNILDARKKFIPEQLVGFVLSFCVIAACVAYGSIEAVAISTSVAAVLQFVVILPFIKGNFRYRPRMNLKDKDLKRTFVLAVPALISVAFDEINALTDRIFGSSIGTGVITSIAKSFTLGQTVLGVLIVPITTIMFTELSDYAARGQMDKLKETVRKSIEIVALITFPIIVISIVCGRDIIGAVYQRGHFTAADTAFTTPVFTLYIIGIFGLGLRTFLMRVFHSMQMTKIPMFVGMISVTLNIVLDLLWMGPLGAKGLTLATTVASFTGAMLMLLLLHKKIGRMNFSKSAGQFVKIMLATCFCFAAAWAVHGLVPAQQATFSAYLFRLLLSGAAGMGVYFLAAAALRIDTMGRVMGMFKKRFSRR